MLSYLPISSSFVIFVCFKFKCAVLLNFFIYLTYLLLYPQLGRKKFSLLTCNLQTGTYSRGLCTVFLCKVIIPIQFFREAFYQTNFRKSRDSKSPVPPGTKSRRCCTGYLSTINRSSLAETSDHFCRWLCISADKMSNERLGAPDTKWQKFPLIHIVNAQLPLQTDFERRQLKQSETEMGGELKIKPVQDQFMGLSCLCCHFSCLNTSISLSIGIL